MPNFESVEGIYRERNPAKRGQKFEVFLSELFRDAGFEVHLNPKAAKPRQTDLLAKKGNLFFLIEAKWTARPSDVDVVFQVKSRLEEATPGMIGCVFSKAGYTSSATTKAGQMTSQEILLFNEAEFATLAGNPSRLLGLIARKRQHLRTHREILFSSGPLYKSEFTPTLPGVSKRFFQNGKTLKSCAIRNENRFAGVLFVPYPTDSMYLGSSRDCFQLEFHHGRIPKQDLKDILALTHRMFNLNGDGNFTIRQNGISWQGIGANDFLHELERREKRYKEAPPTFIHHSEEAIYVDSWDKGLVIFRLTNEVKDQKFFHGFEIEFRTPGIPTNPEQFEEFGRLLDQPGEQLIPLRPQGHWHIRPKKPAVSVVGQLRSSEFSGESIAGIVTGNPFQNRPRLLTPDGGSEEFLYGVRNLSDSAFLICRLSNWLFGEDVVDEFFLERIEFFNLGKVIAVSVAATWKNLLSSPAFKAQPKGKGLNALKRSIKKLEKTAALKRKLGVSDS